MYLKGLSGPLPSYEMKGFICPVATSDTVGTDRQWVNNLGLALIKRSTSGRSDRDRLIRIVIVLYFPKYGLLDLKLPILEGHISLLHVSKCENVCRIQW